MDLAFNDLAFNEEHEELRRSVRRFLDDRAPMAEVRRLMATTGGYDPGTWTQMGAELGLQGLAVPEAFGGSGYGYVELAVVLEEMGRSLLCAPYFATVALAANALLESGDEEAQAELLPPIASGEVVATLAVTEDDGRSGLGAVAARATRSARGWELEGHKSFVIDGHVADVVLVAARSASTPPSAPGAGLSLFAVAGDAPGLTRRALPTMDQTRKQARLELSATPARLIGTDGEAGPGLSRALDLASVALAAEQVGGAQRCLDMSVDYAKVRVQFGRPIGSFQAIKHKCADMLVEVESARSAAYYAAWAAAEGSPELPTVASLAKAYCSDAYFHVAAETIQVHGGIGFTWEHDAHLYFRRAKSSLVMLGDPAYHRELVAERIGI